MCVCMHMGMCAHVCATCEMPAKSFSLLGEAFFFNNTEGSRETSECSRLPNAVTL